MKVKLSRSIAELERENIRYVWEPPDIYDDVHKNNIWLIYGRKGAGKSTVVDYLGTDDSTVSVVIVRPRQTILFTKILVAISESNGDERIIEETVVTVFDFVLTARLISELVPLSRALRPGSARETLYNFMVANKLSGGSTLKKAINFISAIAGDKLQLVPNFAQALDKATGDISLDDAKTALCDHLREIGKTFVLCIDDIDQIGFTYSRVDRIFINGLIVYMVRNNLHFLDQKVRGRILLTTPSELFFQSSLWGSDWVSAKSRCLNWNNPSHLQDLVNKRIAVELDIRKKNPRFPDDKFSIETDQTWKRLFPIAITNKRGRTESAFDYIVRHTFYTPRQILDLCDAVLQQVETPLDPEKLGTNVAMEQWSEIFQRAVEQFTLRVEKDVRTMFGMIYESLDEVIKAFEGRPNIWNRSQIDQYVSIKKLAMKRKYDGKQYAEGDLLHELQQIGFLGLGTRNLNSPVGVESYAMQFSFLEEYPCRKSWEVAVITPIFYDAYEIRSVDSVIVKPHEPLTLTNYTLHKLKTYDVHKNTFKE